MMRRVCCVCHKTLSNGSWQHVAAVADEPVTHGYCPECFAEAMAEIQAVIAERGKNGHIGLSRSFWNTPLTQGSACA
jgi:hypothetical protein